MNTYIIEVHQFPYVLGSDELIKVNTDKDLDTVLEILESKFKKENSFFEYDLYGHTLDNFINGIKLVDINKLTKE